MRSRATSIGLLTLAAVSTWLVAAGAAPSRPGTDSVPIARIRSFDREFTERINGEIRNNFAAAAAGKTNWFHHTIFRDFINETIKRSESATLSGVSFEELQSLRCAVNSRLDLILQKQLVHPEEVRDLLSAKLGQDFLSVRILPAPPPVKDVTVTLAGLHFPQINDCKVATADYESTFQSDVRLQNLCKAKDPALKPVAIEKIDCVAGTPANLFNTGSVISVVVKCQ